MARPTDDEITDWKADYNGADSNSPAGSDVVGSWLDDQFRIVKNVARLESVNKAWERYLGIISSFNFVNATQFTMSGDQTSIALVNRRIKCTVTAGTIYGTITVSAFAAGTTTVTAAFDSGMLDAGLSEVQFSALTTQNSSIPAGFSQTSTALYAVASGTDTYAATLTPAILAYTQGIPYLIKFTNANTGASTLALNGMSAIPMKKAVSTALAAGDIAAGSIHELFYDGTNFQVDGLSASGATTVQMGSGTGLANVGGTFSKQTGAIGNAGGGGDTTLYTTTIPANSFDANGKYLWIYAAGTRVSNGNTKRVKISIGGALLTLRDDTGGTSWDNTLVLTRTSATTLFIFAGSAGSNIVTVPNLTTNTLAVALVGSSSNANEVVANVFLVEFKN